MKSSKFRITGHYALAAATSISAVVASLAAPAVADSGIRTTGNVNMRDGAGTSYAIVGVVPKGASAHYRCWQVGEDVNGVDVWMSVDFEGHTGYITSSLDNSSYQDDEDITNKYGIPPCDETDSADATANDESASPAPDYGLYCATIKAPNDPSGNFTYAVRDGGFRLSRSAPTCLFSQTSAGEEAANGRPGFFAFVNPYFTVQGDYDEACRASYGPQSYAITTAGPLFEVTCGNPSLEFYMQAQGGSR